ncbi:MAG TPA: hypothetical protein VKV15_25115 [Bryobacteraceae bacterium]|nr:hypothetical protein [Bryobacteraceae bacterium]
MPIWCRVYSVQIAEKTRIRFGLVRAFLVFVDVASASNLPVSAVPAAFSMGPVSTSSAAVPSAAEPAEDFTAFPNLFDLLLEDFQIGPDQPPAAAAGQGIGDSTPPSKGQSSPPKGSGTTDPQGRKKQSTESKNTAGANLTLGLTTLTPQAPANIPLLVFSFSLPAVSLTTPPGVEATDQRATAAPAASKDLSATTQIVPQPAVPAEFTAQPQSSNNGADAQIQIAPDLAFAARLTPEIQPLSVPEPANTPGQALQQAQTPGVALPQGLQAGPGSGQQNSGSQADSNSQSPKAPDQAAHSSDPAMELKEKASGNDVQQILAKNAEPQPQASQVLAASTALASTSAAPAARTESVSQAPASAPQVAEAVSEPQTTSRAEPSHGISLRLSGPDSASVDVQVLERSGKVQVAVRSNDADLSSSLRQNLGDLVSNLETKGYKTETWAPAERTPVISSETANDTGSRNSSHSDTPGKGSDQSGGNRDGGGQRQRQQQQGRPFWIQEFENSLDT